VSYARTVAAATAETASKFRLAEALALDIPPREHPGPSDDEPVTTYLEQARQEIITAGGEPRTVQTLRAYRLTAMWVRVQDYPNFAWLPGVSFFAHVEARRNGLKYDEFAAMPSKTIDAVRARAGLSSTHSPHAIRNWSPQQRADAARELLADPDVRHEVADRKTMNDIAGAYWDKQPVQPLRHRDTTRDYDRMVEQGTNLITVALTAERSEGWTPRHTTETLLRYTCMMLNDRQMPEATFNELLREVERYANGTAS